MTWQLAEAKNKFSEVVTLALNDGPQWVTRRNDAVVILSRDEYERITGERQNFKEFLLSGPDFEGLDLSRDKTPMRDAGI